MPASKYSPVVMPIDAYGSLRLAGPEDERIDQSESKYAIGNIMYAAIQIGPRIAFAMGRLIQYLTEGPSITVKL